MASRETSLNDAPLAALAADINADPAARSAWLEVAAARMAAQLMRAARKRRGLSQEDLARALNVSQARISQVESGRVEDIPSLDLIARFLDACGETLVLTAESGRGSGAEAAPARAQRNTLPRRSSPDEDVVRAAAAIGDDDDAEGPIVRPDYAQR